MRSSTIVVMVLALVACEKSKSSPSAGSGSAATAPRPASVTDEMVATFEAYIVAFEKLAGDVEHAGSDCKAVLAVVRDNELVIGNLTPRGDKLSEAMVGSKDREAAGEWFGTTFGERLHKAAEKLQSLEIHCGGNAELRAAMNQTMAMFPMMRKKQQQ